MQSMIEVKERIANWVLEGIGNRLCSRMADAALIKPHCGAGAAFVGRSRREKTGNISDGKEEGKSGGGDQG